MLLRNQRHSIVGILQGIVISSILFVIVIDDMLKCINFLTILQDINMYIDCILAENVDRIMIQPFPYLGWIESSTGSGS